MKWKIHVNYHITDNEREVKVYNKNWKGYISIKNWFHQNYVFPLYIVIDYI